MTEPKPKLIDNPSFDSLCDAVDNIIYCLPRRSTKQLLSARIRLHKAYCKYKKYLNVNVENEIPTKFIKRQNRIIIDDTNYFLNKASKKLQDSFKLIEGGNLL